MASETVDPIDWPSPPPTPSVRRAVPHEPQVLHGVNAGQISQDLLQQPGSEHVSLGVSGQCTACAATQGIKSIDIQKYIKAIEYQ